MFDVLKDRISIFRYLFRGFDFFEEMIGNLSLSDGKSVSFHQLVDGPECKNFLSSYSSYIPRVITFECCLIIMAYPYFVMLCLQLTQGRAKSSFAQFLLVFVKNSFQIHKTFTIYLLLCIVISCFLGENSKRL
jgi:hypothetical protein